MSKDVVIPWELKYKFVRGMLTTLFKGFMYEIRERYGAASALEIHESLNKRDGRIKNTTQTLKNVFKIEGKDCETIREWFDIWWELLGIEFTWLERSKTIARFKVTKCPWKTGYQDIGDWSFNLFNIVAKTINPKTIFERPKAMCNGDPHCEYVYKIEG
jgi:hypothetical protein